MVDEERIDIDAVFHNRVSRPAKEAEESVKDLGDQSEKTGDQVEGMGNEVDKTSKKTDKAKDSVDRHTESLRKEEKALGDLKAELRGLRAENDKVFGGDVQLRKEIRKTELAILKQEAAVNKARRTLAGYTNELDESAKVSRRARYEYDKTTRSVDRHSKAMARWSKIVSKAKSMAFGFLKFMGKWSAIIYVVAGALSFLGTAIQGLGAVAFAGVAGLAPLTGLLITYPGLLANIGQSFAVFKMATSGMGEAFKALNNPDASPEEIAKAMANLTKEQQNFVIAVRDSKEQFSGLRKEVASRAFRGMARIYKQLVEDYLPTLNKYLPKTADAMNEVVKYNARWLKTQSAQKGVAEIMKGNVTQTRNWGKGFSEALRILVDLLRFAQPMLNRMSGDFAEWMKGIRESTEQNGPKIRTFFNNAYDLFKKVADVAGNFIVGIYNIGKLTGVFNKQIGGDLTEMSENFRAFTESREGKRDIRKWFSDMIPVVRELGRWVRDLSGLFTAGSMDPKDFVKSSKNIRKTVIPIATDILQWAAKTLPPILQKIGDTYKNFEEGGVTGGFGRVIMHVANLIVKAGEKVAGMPDWAKTVLGWVTTLAAAYGLLKRAGLIGVGAKGIGGIARGLFGKVTGIGAQKVTVVSFGPVAAAQLAGGNLGSDVVPTGGTPSKLAKGGKFAPFLGGAALTVAALDVGAIYYGSKSLADWLSSRPVKSDPQRQRDWDNMRKDPNFATNQTKSPFTINTNPVAATGAGTGAPNISMNMNYGQDAGYMFVNGQKVPINKPPSTTTSPRVAEQTSNKFTQDMKSGFASVTAVQDAIANSQIDDKLVKPTGALVENMKTLEGLKPKPKIDIPKLDHTVERVDKLVTQLKNTPANVHTTLTIDANQNINRTVTQTTNKYVQDMMPGGGPAPVVPQFTGGSTFAGRDYLVGELGPEAWISNSGQIRMLGLSGPEIVSPGAGATIPTSGTQNPFSGSMGKAPQWAQEAFRAAIMSMATQNAPRQGSGGGNTYIDADIHIPNIPGMDSVAVAKAVRKEIEALQREARERQ